MSSTYLVVISCTFFRMSCGGPSLHTGFKVWLNHSGIEKSEEVRGKSFKESRDESKQTSVLSHPDVYLIL